MVVLCAVLFVTFLDTTLVSVILADIQTSMRAGVQTLQWVVNAYALSFAGLMLAGGMLGDLYGRKRVLIGGLAVFCAGSALAAVAPTATWLLVARVVMGVGAAGSEPGTLSIVRHLYEDRRERARALGAWVAVSGMALAMGPVIAGTLTGLWSWRAVLWFNLVLGGIALIAAWVALPESADPEDAHFDVVGAVLGALTLGTLIVATTSGETAGYTAWWVVGLFVVGGLAGAGFVMVELRRQRPMLDLRLFRNGRFATSNLVAFTTYFGVFSIFFFVALYLQLLAGQSPFDTAADFVPMAIVLILASSLTGRWVARVGPRAPMVVGCLVGGVGILVVDALLGPTAGFAQLSWSLALAGAGFGIALVPVTSAALEAVPEEHSGMAASATNTSRVLGAVFGVAILGAIVNTQLTSDLVQRLRALGIPANFQSIVIEAVTHGGLPANADQAATIDPAAANAGPIVDQVLGAAERAFYTGLHTALLISACLLLASGAIAWFTMRTPVEAGARVGLSHRVARVARPIVAATIVVAVAVTAEWFAGPNGLAPAPSIAASATSTTTASTTTSAPGVTAPAATTPPAGVTTIAPSSSPSTTTAPTGPSISVDPDTGLQDGNQVTVVGSGFQPGISLVALECATEGTATSANDCDISHLQSVTAGTNGSFTISFTVSSGPLGSSGIRCGPDQPCQLAVSPPSADATSERATASLTFR